MPKIHVVVHDDINLRRSWYVVSLCMIAYVLSFIDRQILSLLIGPIKADLKISDTQFGLLNGLAFSIFYATMGVPVAGLSDRKSRPLIIALGVAFWSVATVACGIVRGFPQLFIARVCVGAGEAALSPATYSLISDLFPKEKLGRAVAVYSLGSFLGSGTAFLVGGSIIALVSGHSATTLLGMDYKPWQLVFLIVGAPGVFLALLIWATIKEPFAAGTRPHEADIPNFAAVLTFLKRERAIFAPHMLGFSFAAMALFALLGWSPAYLMRTFGLTPAASGLWLGGVAIIAGGGGVLASGLLMDRLTQKGYRDAPFRTGIIGAAGAVIPAGLLPLATSVPVAVGLLGMAMFFASFPMPPSTAVMQMASPPRMRSRISAIFLCLNSFVGLALGSFLVGLFNDSLFHGTTAVGPSLALVSSSAALLAAIILIFGCRPFRASQKDS
jgi:MFS family permease